MLPGVEELHAKYRNGKNRGGRPYDGANVRMIMAEIPIKNAPVGKAQSRFVASISIQFPGMDETVRAISEEDKIMYPELYAAFVAAEGGEVEEGLQGLSLQMWTLMPRDVCRQFWHMGIKTVEQLAGANGAVSARLGPLSPWIKKAKDWEKGSKSTAAEMTVLAERCEKLEASNAKLREQLELAHQRIDASEGTDLSEQNSKSTSAPRGRRKVQKPVDDEGEDEAA